MSGEHDPASIDINTLFFLLVLTNKAFKPDRKVDEILSFVCFESSEDAPKASYEEAKYLFQIAY